MKTFSIYIEMEVPVGTNFGGIMRELESFSTHLAGFYGRGMGKVKQLSLLGPDCVMVNADALIRLQEKVENPKTKG